jgi:hypothetical protein
MILLYCNFNEEICSYKKRIKNEFFLTFLSFDNLCTLCATEENREEKVPHINPLPELA